MTNRIHSTETCWKLVRSLPVITLVLIVSTFAIVPLLAQTTTGTISGTVVDPGGALIPGAMVSATNDATGESRSTLTSETGSFSFPSLLPATYTIRVELAGFRTFQKTGNILTPNSRLDVDRKSTRLNSSH